MQESETYESSVLENELEKPAESKNTIFTDEMAKAARTRLRAKLAVLDNNAPKIENVSEEKKQAQADLGELLLSYRLPALEEVK